MAKLKIDPIEQPDLIASYWKKDRFVIACIVIFGLTFNIAMILGPIYQGKLIDLIVTGGSLPTVMKLAAIFVALIAAIQLLRYFKRFYIRRFANSTSATMRLMIYNNILHKSMTELDQENTGNLMTRVIADVDLCVEGMRKFTTEIFDTGVLMMAYLVSMLVYDVRITLLAGVFIPAAMLAAEKLKRSIYRFTTAYRQKSSEIAGITYDAIENAMMYRANGVDALNTRKYAAELTDLQDKAIKAGILENAMQPVYNVLAMLGVAAVIYFGGIKVINGQWSVGLFVTYMTMFAALAVKASKAAKLFNSVQKSQVSWQRIKPYLATYQSKDATAPNTGDFRGLSIENLSFAYPEGRGNAIGPVSFSAKPGEIIGITGPIASGKSTLGLALLGLYPYQGSIRIDGRELRDYSESQRSQMIAYLGHQPQLLSDTLYRNITLGNDQDISAVLHDVCFDDELAALPAGWDTPVGNSGIRLSGGQQARVALARALLGKNKVIILDDPFSAVDMKTEASIIANLKAHYRDSILVIISHRLAIFDQIDQIVLLHNDKPAEYGTHQELMQRSELYASIFKLQGTEGGDDHEA